jgi:hypothetical protein
MLLYAVIAADKTYLSAAYYDALVRMRQEQTPRPELVLIDSGSASGNQDGFSGVVDGALARSVVDALLEFDAKALVIQTPVLRLSEPGGPDAGEVLAGFDREFGIITDNIQNLFDGIRIGSIEPAEASRFVGETIVLTQNGKERLISIALSGGSEAGQFEKSQAAFANLWAADDVKVRLAAGKIAPSGGKPVTYSRALPDADGIVRRALPLQKAKAENAPPAEHIVVSALKQQLGGEPQVVKTKYGDALIFGAQEKEMYIDGQGALLFDRPAAKHWEAAIPIRLFIDYAEADKTLYKLLSEAVSMAQSAKMEPSFYPPFIYERNKLLFEAITDEENEAAPDLARAAWQDGRAAYFAACDNFFSGGTEQTIALSFDELIENENLSEEGNERIRTMRDRELEKFYIARDIYSSLSKLRGELEKRLDGAFCVMGERHGETESFSDAEADLLLADALISGHAIKPVPPEITKIIAAAALILLVLLSCALAPLASFLWCVISSALVLWAASYFFVRTGWWLDPLVPALAAAASVFTSAFIALLARLGIGSRQTRHQILEEFLPETRLKTFSIDAANTDVRTYMALAAVRLADYDDFEMRRSPETSYKLRRQFLNEARALFFTADAVLAGVESGLLLFAFGAAPRQPADKNILPKPANAAAAFLLDIDFSKLKTAPWYIGLDAGDCVLRLDAVSGYMALGQAAARARSLSLQAKRRGISMLVSKNAGEHLDTALLKKPAGADTYGEEEYFELRRN